MSSRDQYTYTNKLIGFTDVKKPGAHLLTHLRYFLGWLGQMSHEKTWHTEFNVGKRDVIHFGRNGESLKVLVFSRNSVSVCINPGKHQAHI